MNEASSGVDYGSHRGGLRGSPGAAGAVGVAEVRRETRGSPQVLTVERAGPGRRRMGRDAMAVGEVDRPVNVVSASQHASFTEVGVRAWNQARGLSE